MPPPSNKLLKDLLEHQRQQRQRLLKSKSAPPSWLGKKRHQLRMKINQSWETFRNFATHTNYFFENHDASLFVLMAVFGSLLFFGLLAPWYINLATWITLPILAWGWVETMMAYNHLKHEKNYALQWGDCAVFDGSYELETTENILDKNKYIALLRAAGRKHPHLSEMSQKLIDTVDTTHPYQAHEIAMLLEKEFKVDGWSVVETHPQLMVEVEKEARVVTLPCENKIMKI